MTQYSLSRDEFRLSDSSVDSQMAAVQPLAGLEKTRLFSRWIDWPADRAKIEQKWAALAEQVAEPNCFYEKWALDAAFDALDAGHVRLFTLWSGPVRGSGDGNGDEMLLGIIPLHNEKSYGRWPFPHVRNWLHANAFLGSPLVAAGYEQAFWQALFFELDRKPGINLFFQIESFGLGGMLEAALIDVALTEKRPIGLVEREERAFIHSLDDPQAYFEDAVRGKKRKELRRQQRRLEEMGELSYHRFEGQEALDILPRWIDNFLALEISGWKGKNRSALACHADTEALFRKTLQGAAEANRLQLVTMRFEGQPIAMLVNFLSAPGAFSYKTAYAEDYARFSPGVLLQRYNLDLLTQAGVHWCDSCAAEGHPMIDHLWRERRAVGRYSVGIGSKGRRMLFSRLVNLEQKRMARRAANKRGLEND